MMQYSLCCIGTHYESVATVGSAFAGLNAMSSLSVFLPSYTSLHFLGKLQQAVCCYQLGR